MTDPLDLDPLEAQQENLVTLRAAENEAQRLGARWASAEVEMLAAEVIVKSGLERGHPRIDPAKAAEVVKALRVVRGARSAPPAPSPTSYERSHLEVGLGALRDWLDAAKKGQEPDPGRRRIELIIRLVILALVMAALWAAVNVHVAFLLLLPPVVVPYTMLMRAGDDSKWKRMGAQRHFEKTKLEPPAAWDEPSVEARYRELESAVARVRSNGERARGERPDSNAPEGAGEDEQEDTETRLIEVLAELRIAGGASGWDVAPDIEDWLDKLSEAYAAKRALDELQVARDAAESAAGEAREALFRFLARQGAAPPGGAADADALESGLREVARRGVNPV